jgi:ATP-dependent RNA helicase DHX29
LHVFILSLQKLRRVSSCPYQIYQANLLGDSDLLTVYNAYLAWKRVCVTGASEYQFCRKNFLSQQTLSNIEDLKGQLVVCLVDSGFLPLTETERISLNR